MPIRAHSRLLQRGSRRVLTRPARGLDLAHGETINLLRAEGALCSGILQSAQPEKDDECVLHYLLVALALTADILQPRPAYERLIQRNADLGGHDPRIP